MRVHMKIVIIAAAIVSTITSASGFEGEKRLFTMEKNYNPENIMVIHTQTDADCKFVTSRKNSENNFVEFYWMMNHGPETKEVHPSIRSEIKNRVSFQGMNERKDSFRLRLNDLKELKHDLPDTNMEVTAEILGGGCIIKSSLALGASARYRKLELQKSYCDVSKNFLGIPNGCNYLELSGRDAANGETLKIRFNRK
jgi:hypothetical protein